MTREDITTRQASKIYDALHPTLGFLNQLEERLSRLGFRHDDDYYQMVKAARDTFQRLAVETHYLSCESGVGRSPRSWQRAERGDGER